MVILIVLFRNAIMCKYLFHKEINPSRDVSNA